MSDLVKETEKEYECSECGTTVKDEDIVCPKCGVSLEKSTTNVSKAVSTPFKYHKIFLFAVMLLFGYLVFISAVILFGGRDASMVVWMLQTNQMEVEWWRKILILHPVISIVVNASIVYGIYSYLFPSTKSDSEETES